MITVKLTGQFQKLAPEENEKGTFTVDWTEKTTPDELLRRYDVESVGVKYTVLVNNSRVPKDYTLKDGDYIIAMPLLMGG